MDATQIRASAIGLVEVRRRSDDEGFVKRERASASSQYTHHARVRMHIRTKIGRSVRCVKSKVIVAISRESSFEGTFEKRESKNRDPS